MKLKRKLDPLNDLLLLITLIFETEITIASGMNKTFEIQMLTHILVPWGFYHQSTTSSSLSHSVVEKDPVKVLAIFCPRVPFVKEKENLEKHLHVVNI